MFTIKYIEANGEEYLEGGFVRTATWRHPETKLLTVTGHRADGSQHAFFQAESEQEGQVVCPRLYIMNEAGRTVADYLLAAPLRSVA